MSWITATYLIESEPERIEARAKALALEQSIECPPEAVTEQWILDEIVARVASIEEIEERRYRVDVSIASVTTGCEPAQLMNMIFGNCSLWENVQFVDVTFPPEVLAAFPGPRHGIDGIRRLLDVPRRALTATATKPQGLSVEQLAQLCRTFALAGVDIIKDDHGIADQSYSPFSERIRACQRAVTEAAATTGRRALYVPNLIGTPRVLRERARMVRDEGIKAVMVGPMVVGLPAFADLVAEFPEFVYLAHPSAGGAGRIAPSLLFGRLFRLFGADAVIFVNYGGRFSYPQDVCASVARELRSPWDAIAPALPVPAGGMLVERVDELLDFYGLETMLLIGGNLLIARERLLERTRDFVERVALRSQEILAGPAAVAAG